MKPTQFNINAKVFAPADKSTSTKPKTLNKDAPIFKFQPPVQSTPVVPVTPKIDAQPTPKPEVVEPKLEATPVTKSEDVVIAEKQMSKETPATEVLVEATPVTEKLVEATPVETIQSEEPVQEVIQPVEPVIADVPVEDVKTEEVETEVEVAAETASVPVENVDQTEVQDNDAEEEDEEEEDEEEEEEDTTEYPFHEDGVYSIEELRLMRKMVRNSEESTKAQGVVDGLGLIVFQGQKKSANFSQGHGKEKRMNRDGRSARGGRKNAGFGSNRYQPMSEISDADIKPIENTDNRYIAKSKEELDENERKLRLVKASLNKLAEKNFDAIKNAIIDTRIDNEDLMRDIVDASFEKAVAEPGFVVVYARLFEALANMSVKKATGSWAEMSVAKSDFSFRKTLLLQCQKFFDGNTLPSLAFGETDEDVVMNVERDRKRYYGAIRFYAELYNVNLLASLIIFTCVKKLLEDNTPESYDALVKLLTTCGARVELDEHYCSPAKNTPEHFINKAYEELDRIESDKSFPSRLRFMIMDLKDLRKTWHKVSSNSKSDAASTSTAASNTVATRNANAPKRNERGGERGERGERNNDRNNERGERNNERSKGGKKGQQANQAGNKERDNKERDNKKPAQKKDKQTTRGGERNNNAPFRSNNNNSDDFQVVNSKQRSQNKPSTAPTSAPKTTLTITKSTNRFGSLGDEDEDEDEDEGQDVQLVAAGPIDSSSSLDEIAEGSEESDEIVESSTRILNSLIAGRVVEAAVESIRANFADDVHGFCSLGFIQLVESTPTADLPEFLSLYVKVLSDPEVKSLPNDYNLVFVEIMKRAAEIDLPTFFQWLACYVDELSNASLINKHEIFTSQSVIDAVTYGFEFAVGRTVEKFVADFVAVQLQDVANVQSLLENYLGPKMTPALLAHFNSTQ